MEIAQLREEFKHQLKDTHPLSVESARRALEIAQMRNDQPLIARCQADLDNRVGQQCLFYVAEANGKSYVWKIWAADLETLCGKVVRVVEKATPNSTVPRFEVNLEHATPESWDAYDNASF